MLKALVKGNSIQTSYHFKVIIPRILANLQSPLAAPHVMKVFLELRTAVVFPRIPIFSDVVRDAVAHVTLRLENPKCDLDFNWCEINLIDHAVAVVDSIYFATVKKALLNGRPFTTPALCYVFYAIKDTLLLLYNSNEHVVHTCLDIISEHVKLNTDEELYSPVHLPRKEIFGLLIFLISIILDHEKTIKANEFFFR